MANRNFRRDFSSPDQGLVFIDGVININATNGATTSDTLTFASASCKSLGDYRIHLEDYYSSLKSCTLTLENTGTQGLVCKISGSSVDSGKYVDFLTGYLTGSGTGPNVFAVGRASNVTAVHVNLVLKNSAT